MFGAGQAKRYHNELFALFDLIAVNPRIGANGMRLIRPLEFIPSKHISSSIGLKTMRKFS